MFRPTTDDIDALVAQHPLAHFISAGADGLVATPLPLLLDRPKDGPPTLLGHFARTNPQIAALEERPEALAIFIGPHGYMSPSWLSDRTQAPTWNFATVRMSVRVTIDRSLAAAHTAVDRLTTHMEAGRPAAWSSADMGSRLDRLIPHVVAFTAEVLAVEAKLKLGQNERPDVLAELMTAVEREGDPALHAAMQAANAARWPPSHPAGASR